MRSALKSDSEEKTVKLPVTEIVDQDERFRYGPEGDIGRDQVAKPSPTATPIRKQQATSPPPPSQSGVVAKTGQLLSSVGSTLWSGATGAVSLGFGVLRTGVNAGSSAITGVASGVAGLVHLRSSATGSESNATANENDSEKSPSEPPAEFSATAKVKSYLPKSLLRGSQKDKAD
ncbi:unnamed protein product [Dibothriocephalus latus]|uniref:Uncharacterized protein n=1 Tax=Dibothriocephalus latus TaxID=60516 RepID=A0A3P6TCD1_DIBLA|nr:unnamed protein product [Dibothriocephalus latus]